MLGVRFVQTWKIFKGGGKKGRKRWIKGKKKIEVWWAKKGNGKHEKIILPLQCWEAFSNRAWEGFQNQWNNIHPFIIYN